MPSTDNPHTENAMARAVGIHEARGNPVPTQKIAAIEALLTSADKDGMAEIR